MSENGGIEEKLAHLKRSYVDQLPVKIVKIEQAAVFSDGIGAVEPETSLKAVMSLAHKLAGSGAIFGFPDISEAAKSVENMCGCFLQDGNPSTGPVIKYVDNAINSLKQAVTAAVSSGGGHGVELDQEDVSDAASHKEPPVSRIVILVGCDEGQEAKLRSELASFGLQVLAFGGDTDPGDLDLIPVPAGIVFDLDFLIGRDISGATPLSVIRLVLDGEGVHCPLIAISSCGDVSSRLLGARARATSFLVKPVLTPDLVDSLDTEAAQHGDENYRILIVDDDESMASYTKIILDGAGMIAATENNPMNILRRLEDFSPELILMDLYMPSCNGHELAAVIRQLELFAGIPIVFLSGEDDVDKQLGAMQYGGDDFLTKPIRSSHLISAVKTRSRRFRDLRARMIRDSMTGLLNHTTTQEFLKNEINRAKREKTPLVLAAIDIDNFKLVNDTYGHAVGDVVIKSLSILLRQRLRSNDIIGRMGGEEFAAVLVGAPIEKAGKILDEIRLSFANVTQTGDGKEFFVTLSCGIAEFPDFGTQAELLKAADKALYEAKHSGRNRVVTA